MFWRLIDDHFVGLVIVVTGVFTLLLIYAVIHDHDQWIKFKTEQNCKIVGKEKEHVNTVIMPIVSGNGGVGIIVSTTSDKTGWLCDDGITYWR